MPTATDDDLLLVQNTLDELYEDIERLFCGGSAIGDIVDASKAPRQWRQRLMGNQPYFRVWLEEELESYLKKRNNEERQRWEEARAASKSDAAASESAANDSEALDAPENPALETNAQFMDLKYESLNDRDLLLHTGGAGEITQE